MLKEYSTIVKSIFTLNEMDFFCWGGEMRIFKIGGYVSRC